MFVQNLKKGNSMKDTEIQITKKNEVKPFLTNRYSALSINADNSFSSKSINIKVFQNPVKPRNRVGANNIDKLTLCFWNGQSLRKKHKS